MEYSPPPTPYPFTSLLFLSEPLFWPQLSSRGWCGPPNRRVHILQSLSPEGFEFQTNTLKKFRPAPKVQGAKFHSAKLYGELAPHPPLQFPLPPPIVAVHQSEKVWYKQRPFALNANGRSAPLSPGKVNGTPHPTPPAPPRPLSLPLQHSLKEGSWLRPHVTSGIRWGHCPFHCTGGND